VTYFHFDIGERARHAGRFIGRVRGELLRALSERKSEIGFSQQGLAQKLDGPARQQYALDYLIDMKLVANFHSVAFLELGSYDAFRSRIRKPPALVEPPPRIGLSYSGRKGAAVSEWH